MCYVLLGIHQTICTALTSQITEQILLPEIRKLWKYYLFTKNIQTRDQKSVNFEWIRKNVGGGKNQFQEVLP